MAPVSMLTTPEVAALVSKSRGRKYTKNAVAVAIQDGRLRAERVGPIWLVAPPEAAAFAELQAAREGVRRSKAARAKANARSKRRAAKS